MTIDVSSLNVSFTFVALCTFAPFLLTAWIGMRRGKLGILRGHGDDAELFWRSRAHGNFTENAPLVALALLVAEAVGVSDLWPWARRWPRSPSGGSRTRWRSRSTRTEPWA